jgi:CBS domain-containing protein
MTHRPDPKQEALMLAQDVMTTGIATVPPDTALAAAIEIMLTRHVSGLPVVDGDGRLVGVLTEGDLLRRAETGTEPTRPRWLDFIMGPARLAEDYVRTHSRRVADLMTHDVVTVSPETTLADVVALMESHRIKRLPVLHGGTLVGIVTRTDLLRALADALKRASQPQHATDRQIRDAIVAEFTRQRWAPVDRITVHVDEGHVVLEGIIFDNVDRAALTVAAQNVAGVKSVRDDLEWVEPTTGATLGPLP